jgi:bifunctional DNA-binding transcriptional regulator/antitoxin component of YhaV-PrlF toxin-antitoxin module
MSTLTVTAKGQVTLRKDVLEHLGVHPGERNLREQASRWPDRSEGGAAGR